MAKVTLELLNLREDKTRKLGPFSFVQVTYFTLRVPEQEYQAKTPGNMPGEVGAFSDDGYWIVDGERWSDFSVYVEGGENV